MHALATPHGVFAILHALMCWFFLKETPSCTGAAEGSLALTNGGWIRVEAHELELISSTVALEYVSWLGSCFAVIVEEISPKLDEIRSMGPSCVCVQYVLEEFPCTLSQLEMDHASLILFSAWKVLAWTHCKREADYWMLASFGLERIHCNPVLSPRASSLDLLTFIRSAVANYQ